MAMIILKYYTCVTDSVILACTKTALQTSQEGRTFARAARAAGIAVIATHHCN